MWLALLSYPEAGGRAAGIAEPGFVRRGGAGWRSMDQLGRMPLRVFLIDNMLSKVRTKNLGSHACNGLVGLSSGSCGGGWLLHTEREDAVKV